MNIPRTSPNIAPNTQNGGRDAQGEEETIRDYFKKGFTYDEILKYGIRMSIATLKRRIKVYGLKRRNVRYDLNSV